MRIFFSVPGDPKTQQRHRSFRMGTKMSTYDPSAKEKKDFLVLAFNEKPEKPMEGPISMTIKLYYSRPKNHYGSGKNASNLKPTSPHFHTSRPDADNAFKFVSDSLNSVFYKDDSQICMLQVIKLYSETPRTEILIENL